MLRALYGDLCCSLSLFAVAFSVEPKVCVRMALHDEYNVIPHLAGNMAADGVQPMCCVIWG